MKLKKRFACYYFPLAASIILFILFYTFRYYYHMVDLSKPVESFILTFIFVLGIYKCRSRIITTILVCYLTIGIVGQFIHFGVYGNWMAPIEIWMFFSKFQEVVSIGQGLTNLIFVPLIYSIIFICIVAIIVIKRSPGRSYYLDIILLLALVYLPARILITNSTLGLTPEPTKGIETVNFNSLSYFFGATFPQEAFNFNAVEKYSHDPYQVENSGRIQNVIFIMGESNSASHDSVFGYTPDTMPFLRKMKDKEGFLLKKTYSAGVLTDVSLPSIFNLALRPNSYQQIISEKTNLFKMADQQGYESYFYSMQARDALRLMHDMGIRWINHYRNSFDYGYSSSTNGDDFKLLDSLKQINLKNGKHFIVLHQIGSHSPYSERTPLDKQIFANDNLVSQYDNSIHYTDSFIQAVYQYLRSLKTNNWTLIYTSDHGQTVTARHFSQGLLGHESQYIVPTLIYSPNKSAQELYQDHFSACPMMFHQQIATFTAYLLGYHITISDCQHGFVNGPRLQGNAGYLTFSLINGGYKKQQYP